MPGKARLYDRPVQLLVSPAMYDRMAACADIECERVSEFIRAAIRDRLARIEERGFRQMRPVRQPAQVGAD